MRADAVFWLCVAVFGFGYLVGYRRGWAELLGDLWREGYRVMLSEGRPAGEGRLTVIEKAPPF